LRTTLRTASGSKIVDAALDGGVDRGLFVANGTTASLLAKIGQSLNALLIRPRRLFLPHDFERFRADVKVSDCEPERVRSRP